MTIEIRQKQNRVLLEEHAKFSFNFGFLGKNELYIAITFLILGILISIIVESNRLVGLPFIIIGFFEMIKYPTRELRWIRKKEKELIFNKDLEFLLEADSLTIRFDEISRTHKYVDMRECLISEKGILFKISKREYYYISFNLFKDETDKIKLSRRLEEIFDSSKIRIKPMPKTSRTSGSI